MTDVFLDTVGIIAVWDDTDQWHADARAAYARLLRQGRKLVPTPLVLLEWDTIMEKIHQERKGGVL